MRLSLRILAATFVCLILAGCVQPTPPTESTGSNTAPTEATVEILPTEEPTQAATEAPTEPPIAKIATATIGTTGDILLHDRVIQSGYQNGVYNYDHIFQHIRSYAGTLDYAVANLEVTLRGDGNYRGYPCFNSPDEIVDALRTAGFDMLLTANNHSYDTGHEGLLRTQQVIDSKGLVHIGTHLDLQAPRYHIATINGIRIGMLNYTYNTAQQSDGRISLNGTPLRLEDSQLVNSFNYQQLDQFYATVSQQLEEMRSAGADAIMLFIHWGTEYETYANTTQKKMAQALCDLGIDVIVGNHAHVIQPIALLSSSTDESEKTLCLYSTGNAVSNIYQTSQFPVHTEDGMFFTVRFAKYSDGTVLLEGAEVLPTWVYRRYDEAFGMRRHEIIPLSDDQATWQESMNLSESVLRQCVASHKRTMDIVGQGLAQANEYYRANQLAVEAALGITG